MEDNHPASVSRAARVGMVLFLIYVALYAGFMYLTAFRGDVMKQSFAGVNVAVAYGMGLILAAFVLAAIYLFLARPPVK